MKFKDKLIAQIKSVELLEQGKFPSQVAKELKISSHMAQSISRRMGIKRKRGRPVGCLSGLGGGVGIKILDELKQGKPQSEIATKLKVSRQYVSQLKYRYLS